MKHITQLTYLIGTSAFLSMTHQSSAAITMTIDVATETISYSGTISTSEAFMSNGFTVTTYFLANQATNNPNPSPNSTSTNSVILSSTISPVSNAYNIDSVGQVSVTHNIGLISIFLGTDINLNAARNITLTATPNGSGTQSYAGFIAANKTHIESLDGVELFFVDRVTSSFVNTVGGGPAVTINVVPIPEPSSTALVGLGSMLLLTRRRRSH